MHVLAARRTFQIKTGEQLEVLRTSLRPGSVVAETSFSCRPAASG